MLNQKPLNLFQIAGRALSSLVMTGIHGGAVAMFCYVGLGLLQGGVGHSLAKMLPTAAGMGTLLLIPLGLAAVTFVYAMCNDFGEPDVSFEYDQERAAETQTFLSFVLTWVLPTVLFAVGFNVVGVGLAAASGIAFGAATLGSAYWTFVLPLCKDLALRQNIMLLQEEERRTPVSKRPESQALPPKQFSSNDPQRNEDDPSFSSSDDADKNLAEGMPRPPITVNKRRATP